MTEVVDCDVKHEHKQKLLWYSTTLANILFIKVHTENFMDWLYEHLSSSQSNGVMSFLIWASMQENLYSKVS